MTLPHRTAERRAFLITLVLFAAWTGTTAAGVWSPMDRAVARTPVLPGSAPRQLAEAFALVTHPVLLFSLILVLSLWALRRRLRRLALALAIAAVGLPVWQLVRSALDLPRPPQALSDSLSSSGPAYPSGHVLAAAVIVWVAVTLANARRKSARATWLRRLVGAVFIVVVSADQLALATQGASDLVGGYLLGVCVASGALWLSGVDRIRRSLELRGLPEGSSARRAAVIYNPTKVTDHDLFRRRVEHALRHAGWDPPLWLATSREDPGGGVARYALELGAAMVLVAGGDGTVRAVCSAMAGSGVPVGLLPAGTGNLLCRNLGIPLDEDLALATALRGVATEIDLINTTTDVGTGTFAVMSGIGFDALIMDETNTDLKRVIGGGAYLVAAAQQARMKPFVVEVTVDDTVLPPREATMVLIGNVGKIQGGIEVFPAARPDDNLLDVLIASSNGLRDWPRLIAAIRRGESVAGVERLQGRRVTIVVDRPMAYQLDGDAEGQTERLTAQVAPGTLIVMRPRTLALVDRHSRTGTSEPRELTRAAC